MLTMKQRRLALAAILLAQAFGFSACARADEPARVPAPLVDETVPHAGATEVAVLSGGCFWGMQGLFEHVKGVRDYLVDLASTDDFAALGRVMNAVTDGLIECHPEADIRP
jgi:hypothetical protein